VIWTSDQVKNYLNDHYSETRVSGHAVPQSAFTKSRENRMRSVVISAIVAVAGGIAGAALTQSDMLRPAKPTLSRSVDPDLGWTAPAVSGYGKIHYEANAAFQPNAALSNKVVFKVSRGAEKRDQVNPALEQVAQVVNTYVAAGVPVQQLKFVVAVNGEATPAMLDNAHFKARFGMDNPNLPLISELKKQGVQVTVCDQALAWHRHDPHWIAEPVIHTLSALTTVTTLQNQGYALLSM